MEGGRGAQRFADFRLIHWFLSLAGQGSKAWGSTSLMFLFCLRLVQGLVGEPIGFAILFARHMLDRKRLQTRNQFPRPLAQGFQPRTLHLIDALDLERQQL